MIDFPPMTEDVSKSIIKANRITAMIAYKSFKVFGGPHSPVASSISQPILSLGANTKIAETPKTSAIAESPGPIKETYYTPSISRNEVMAKIVIPSTAAVVKQPASNGTPGVPC